MVNLRCNFMIIGQGLAGCLLAKTLGERGASCMLVGENSTRSATPAAAGMVLFPLIVGIETGWDFCRSAWVTLPWTIVVSGLMIAPIPTYSFKHIRIRVPRRFITLSLASVGLLAAALITEPWLTLSALIVAFSASIPFAALSFKKRQGEDGS